MSNEYRTEEDPHNRVTDLCDAMIKVLEDDPDFDDELCIIMLTNKYNKECGMVFHGYESDSEAVADILIHLRAALKSVGKELAVFVR